MSGKVAVHGRLAIVTQPAWLQAATIRCAAAQCVTARYKAVSVLIGRVQVWRPVQGHAQLTCQLSRVWHLVSHMFGCVQREHPVRHAHGGGPLSARNRGVLPAARPGNDAVWRLDARRRAGCHIIWWTAHTCCPCTRRLPGAARDI